jgi:hypothetical protein
MCSLFTHCRQLSGGFTLPTSPIPLKKAFPSILSTTKHSNPSSGSKTASSSATTTKKPQTMMLCKVLVVGNAKCGKTSLIRRFSSDAFDSVYNTTVGTDFARKDIHIGKDTKDSQLVNNATLSICIL